MLTLSPETIDTIIDFLHDDKQALMNCGLVCWEWYPSSRYHLFETLNLGWPGSDYICFPDNTPYGPIIAESNQSTRVASFVRAIWIDLETGDLSVNRKGASQLSTSPKFPALKLLRLNSGLGRPWGGFPTSTHSWVQQISLNITSLTLGCVNLTAELKYLA